MCRRWRNTTLKPGSRRPHLGARWATSCARGWKQPIMSTRGPASSRFSLTMNEPSFDRRPAHATDRSGPVVFDAMVPSIYPVCLRPRCNAAIRFSTDSDDPGPRYPDQRHRRLLRPRRERPSCRCAAKQRDELASPHVEHRGASNRLAPPVGLPHAQALNFMFHAAPQLRLLRRIVH
jgi:hypothetical protein